MLRDRVNRDIGRAVEILYNLDIALSNHYIGDGGSNDKAVNQVRDVV